MVLCCEVLSAGDTDYYFMDSAVNRDHGHQNHITTAEYARHVILSFRLRRSYLVYCISIFLLTFFVFSWNLRKGIYDEWNMPGWRHHQWEEALEVFIGSCMTVETIVTMRLLGLKTFFGVLWHIFDFVVMVLTILSVLYALDHLSQGGETCEADMLLLMIRFLLQPVRVMTTLAEMYRVHEMQKNVEELSVDFNALPQDSTNRLKLLS